MRLPPGILPIGRWPLLLVLCALAGCGGGDRAAAADEAVTVFAASSLREAMTEIAEAWAERGGPSPRLEFAASSMLARQIVEGAGADVYVSAAPEWVDEVAPLQRHDWLGNRLVLVVPREAPDVDLRALESLTMAARQVPAGKYAHAALAHLGIAPPRRTIYGSSVRDVLAKVSRGGAEAGIVYATDAAIDPAVRVSFRFPAQSHPRIVYTAALLTEAGRGFFDALQAPWALEIAGRYGFSEAR